MTEVIPAALAGERVDRVVALLTGLTRSEVVRLVDQGAVRLGGRPVEVRSRRVQTGETLEVEVPDRPASTGPQPEPDVNVPVVYADDELIVVDKPAGLVVHPGAGHDRDTLVNGLVARFPDLADLADVDLARDRPGIVHRLDKGTSGLLVVARTTVARESLVRQLANREAERRYAALVWGSVVADSGLIDAPVRRAEVDPTRMAIRAGGKPARTRYQVERRFTSPVEATLLACRLETGRTHQIRVHLAAIGHPVAGDPRYGRDLGTSGWPAGVPRLPGGRVWLHARQLAFDHPRTGQRLTFTSPLPADLEAVLAGLR
ncbi:MAG TPA: RluA family pseudouridine synthase [Acidimicrobiales bacterium]|nr:RluA family pseudouridine synthase [Acidimicrobiales bacterium]